MIALVIFLICIFVIVAVGALAAWSDLKGMTIPNWHSGVVMGSFFVAFFAMRFLGHGEVFSSIFSHLVAGGIVFLMTVVLFALKSIGAADSKLSTAYAFWAGVHGLPAFLFYMTLAGGLIGLTAIALGKWKPVKNPPAGSWVARVQAGENKVPYGVAIVVGALACFLNLGYFGKAVLTILG